MADQKITALTELAATPDDADILAIVDDVAETPVTKKITVANLKAASGGARFFLCQSHGEAVVNNANRYACWSNDSFSTSLVFEFRTYINRAGTVKNLYVFLENNPGAVNVVFTVRKNGADQALTCTVNNATTANDTAHSLSVAAGDYLELKIASPDGTTPGKVHSVIEIE